MRRELIVDYWHVGCNAVLDFAGERKEHERLCELLCKSDGQERAAIERQLGELWGRVARLVREKGWVLARVTLTVRSDGSDIPRSDWKIREAEELRIVPEDVWQAVQQRSALVQNNFRKGLPKGLCSRSFSSRYFLSGFLKCGLCGSALTIVSGRACQTGEGTGVRFIWSAALAQMG